MLFYLLVGQFNLQTPPEFFLKNRQRAHTSSITEYTI